MIRLDEVVSMIDLYKLNVALWQHYAGKLAQQIVTGSCASKKAYYGKMVSKLKAANRKLLREVY